MPGRAGELCVAGEQRRTESLGERDVGRVVGREALPQLQPAPKEGLGQALAGLRSRRIDEEHRLVYLVDGEDLIVVQVRYHYG